MDDLKKQAEELGIKVDKRWSDQRLQAEIDEKLAAEPEQEVVAPAPVVEPEVVAVPVELEPCKECGQLLGQGNGGEYPCPSCGEPLVHDEPELSAEEKASADAEIEAEIQARFDASQDDGSVVIINLQANPMKVLGLTSYGEATLTAAQLADPRFYAKVERAKTLGLIKVKS